MEALNRNNTRDITDLPKGRKHVGSKWVYKIKYKSNGEIERYKARFVAKGCSKKEGLDYEETFPPVVKMVTIRYVLSLVVQNQWSIFQLDVNNAFLYGELDEDVYMSLSDGYYVPGDKRVWKLKRSLPTSTPIELSQAMHGPLKSNLKLAFLVLRYIKGAPGKGVLYNKSNKFALSAYVDSDWAKCNVIKRSVTGYTVFLGSCLVSWKSKKQSVLAKSSAETEYRAMSSVACEIIWILKLLIGLKVDYSILVDMFCDSSAAMPANPVFSLRGCIEKDEVLFGAKCQVLDSSGAEYDK
ncbi:ribonuclease H-like domain-containing protein [Tanacetum coccineum]